MLTTISPIDGRYFDKTKTLSVYFSEQALIKYRVLVEIAYFKALCDLPLPQLSQFDKTKYEALDAIVAHFSLADGEAIKAIERTTNHDVKAVEYFIKEKFDELGLADYKEFIHFGLTSQDINNTATPMMITQAMFDVILPMLDEVSTLISEKAKEYSGIPMLAKTHGQPASPTTLGKEFDVYSERLEHQIKVLKSIDIKAKFGGATGNLNAHKVTYPDIDWPAFADRFVASLGLERAKKTTQIEHYDTLAEVCHSFVRINNILIDLCRDIWTYISMDYFKQRVIANEVGSSAMPHKVNPIDFENAEGNLGLANAIFEHLASKLPISRLQRDLTDSTVLRNIGVPFAHDLIALLSIKKGISKLLLNEQALNNDLEQNWAVVAEAIQNILRREQYPQPYEALKALTRGKTSIKQEDIVTFIRSLPVADAIKVELLAITPQTYVGYY